MILRFALPLLIGDLLQQLYNIANSTIVGQFLGKESLAAVLASSFICYFIILLMIDIRSGTSMVTSQFFGAKEFDKVQKAFSSFSIFMLATGVLLSIAGVILAESMLGLANIPEDVTPQTAAYLRTYVRGVFLPVTFSSTISILQGAGESARPILFILLTTILNIALGLLFIVVLKQGIEGTARATVITQGIGMCVALGYVNNIHPLLSIKKRDLLFDMGLFKEGLRTGLPSSVQQCATSLGLIALLGIVNSFGTDTLTVYGVVGRIGMIITQAVLTLSEALAAFCEQNVGAGYLDRIYSGVRFVMFVNLLLGLAILMAIYFFGDKMMLAFIKDPEVIRIDKEYLLIMGGLFIVRGGLNIFNRVLRGAGDTLFPMAVSATRLRLIRIPLAYRFSSIWGRNGIWWATGISLRIGPTITYIYYKLGFWKNKGLLRKK